jgi:serine/threonine protein kinase
VVARFETERQALALMDHPNIARVYDGGATPGGRPYFVMELVKGIHIHNYCDQCQLTLRERLQLFVQVCRAVQHAHQKGIIHRDLKPSNVLVAIQDGKPVPKVIDFGVAKATGPRLTDATFHTRFAQMIGTPQYMSPEQAEMSALDVDTRTDIYALGVLLYELLTGTTPFTRERMNDATFDELRRIIREEDPPTPSARLTELNGQGTEAAAARRTDLCDEPVEARPPSGWYRAKKLARRNRAGVTIAVLVLALIALAGGAVGWTARDRSARQAAADKNIAGALRQVRSSLEAGRLPEAREAVRRAEGLLAGSGASEVSERSLSRWRRDVEMLTRLNQARLARALWDEASLDSSGADLAYRMAFRWYNLDVLALDPADASIRLERAAIRDGIVVALDDWLTCCRTELHKKRLRALLDRTDSDPWRRRCREALRRGDRSILRNLSLRSNHLGKAFHAQGRFDEAISAYLKSIELYPGAKGAYHGLGRALQNAGRLDEAVATFRASIKLDLGDPWPHLNLGHALRAQGKFEEARVAYETALKVYPGITGNYTYIGLALAGEGKFGKAVAACRKATDRYPDHAFMRSNLGLALLAHREFDEAAAACRKAIQLDPGHEAAYVTLGSALLGRGEYMNPFHRWFIGRDRLAEASVHSRLAWVFATVPVAELRDPARATELAKRSVDLGPSVGGNWLTLGVAQYRAGDDDAAIAALDKSMALQHGGNGYDWFFLAMAHARSGRQDNARGWYDRAVGWVDQNRPDDDELRRFQEEAAQLLKTDNG